MVVYRVSGETKKKNLSGGRMDILGNCTNYIEKDYFRFYGN